MVQTGDVVYLLNPQQDYLEPAHVRSANEVPLHTPNGEEYTDTILELESRVGQTQDASIYNTIRIPFINEALHQLKNHPAQTPSVEIVVPRS